jgi:hypothetical protein
MRRVVALGLAASALALALAGCSDDIATVPKGKVQSCLSAAGANPRDFAATSAQSPPQYAALLRENGARGAIAVLGTARRTRDAWAYVFFFNGAERADTVYGRLTGGRDKVKIGARTVPSTRRQNVIVLYGRKRAYGRTAGPADRQQLERCFDEAS